MLAATISVACFSQASFTMLKTFLLLKPAKPLFVCSDMLFYWLYVLFSFLTQNPKYCIHFSINSSA